jgi:dienelactone hydrolase
MKTRRLVLTLAALLALAGPASGEVKTKAVEYRQDGTVLQGFFAWDDAKTGKRPGVLVIHEWWGHNEHARQQATRLAEAGYVAFALDMYGKGKLATHPKDAQAFASEVMSKPDVAAARFNAALAQLKQDSHVDPEKIAAFGYCFGGGVALAMARAGADLDAVVTFHGALATQNPAKPGAVKPRILVLTGAADPMVPPAQVEAFKAEMKAAGASAEVVSYPGVKHSFTNPGADKVGMDGLSYDAAADKNSWAKAMTFLSDVFK